LQQCVDYRRLDESGGEVTKEAKSWQAGGSSLGGKREELRRRIYRGRRREQMLLWIIGR